MPTLLLNNVGERMNARIVIVMNTNSFLLDCSIEVREKKKIALIRSFRVAQGNSLADVRFPRIIGLQFSTTVSKGNSSKSKVYAMVGAPTREAGGWLQQQPPQDI